MPDVIIGHVFVGKRVTVAVQVLILRLHSPPAHKPNGSFAWSDPMGNAK